MFGITCPQMYTEDRLLMVTLCLEVPQLTLCSSEACRGKVGIDICGFCEIHPVFQLLYPDLPSTFRITCFTEFQCLLPVCLYYETRSAAGKCFMLKYDMHV